MKDKYKFSIIGGDSRQIYATNYLAQKGYKLYVYGLSHGQIKKSDNVTICNSLEKTMSNDIIILPLPFSKNNRLINAPLSDVEIKIKEIIDNTSQKNRIFLGMVNDNIIKEFMAKGKSVCDYYKIESLIYKNALLTAEGILNIILDKLPITIFGLNIAITGYGRIASLLANMLSKLNANVSVFARSESQRTIADVSGINAYNINELYNKIHHFDCLVNTVPSMIITDDLIKRTKDDILIIESASAPYGIDFDSCIKNERNLIKAFSLPGRSSPKTAGIIIAKTIISEVNKFEYP